EALAIVLRLEEAEAIALLELQAPAQRGLVVAGAADLDARHARQRRSDARTPGRSAEGEIVAERVEPVAVVERHGAQIDPGARLVADDPGQAAAFLQALRQDDVPVRAERLAEGQPRAGIGFTSHQAGVEPDVRRAALDARGVEPDRAPGRGEDAVRHETDQ